MKLTERAFPHPVVGNSDDVLDSAFQATIEPKYDHESYHISVRVACSSPTICELVNRGQACYVLHVECGNTLYREKFDFNSTEWNVVIPRQNLHSTVDVNVFVIAQRDIRSYRIENAHPDYGNMSFSVETGDILAVAEGLSFDADIDFDMLRSVRSIVEVAERTDDQESAPVVIDLNYERIRLVLSKADFATYRVLRTNKVLSQTLIAMLVIPALVEAITVLRGSGSDYEELRWYRCLKKKIEVEGHSLESAPYTLAQELLKFPVRRALQGLQLQLEGA
jgi:hypothetical protein